MNATWSNLNKEFQEKLNKKMTFDDAKKCLLQLRKLLIAEILSYKTKIDDRTFKQISSSSKGYESKSIAYALYHIIRIEDIVANMIILKKQDIFTKSNYINDLKIDITTTGNELSLTEISQCFGQMNIEVLYKYIMDVTSNTDTLITNLQFDDLKTRFSQADKDRLIKAKVVSPNENAFWLIDYWCNKDLKGLLKMPFSRHLIMHIEACNRIIHKLK